MINKGTVIEVNKGRAMVMTEQCEFVEITARGAWQPGDEVTFAKKDIVNNKGFSFKPLALVASFILCCVIAISVFQYLSVQKAFAYIGLDISSGIELGINQERRVISVTGLNGEDRAKNKSLLHQNIDAALETVLEETPGIIEKEGTLVPIAVYLSCTGEADASKLLEDTGKVMEEYFKSRDINARVYYFIINDETRQLALKNNTAPDKYLLWTELKKRGQFLALKEITLEDPRVSKVAGAIDFNFPGQYSAVKDRLADTENLTKEAAVGKDLAAGSGQTLKNSQVPRNRVSQQQETTSKGASATNDGSQGPVEQPPGANQENGAEQAGKQPAEPGAEPGNTEAPNANAGIGGEMPLEKVGPGGTGTEKAGQGSAGKGTSASGSSHASQQGGKKN